jgi:hypothetical protein
MCTRPQVWAVPTTAMQCRWLGERVATPGVGHAITNATLGRLDAGWGPNAVFRFPRRGGTGAIQRGVAALLPPARQVRACAYARRVMLKGGTTLQYEALVSTLPMDTLLTWLGREVRAQGLQHSSTHIIGVGVRGVWCVREQWRRRRCTHDAGLALTKQTLLSTPQNCTSPPPTHAPLPQTNACR